jgi:hypothetical protein
VLTANGRKHFSFTSNGVLEIACYLWGRDWADAEQSELVAPCRGEMNYGSGKRWHRSIEVKKGPISVSAFRTGRCWGRSISVVTRRLAYPAPNLPIWIGCRIVGILVSVSLRPIFITTGIDEWMTPRPFIYSCLALIVAFLCWRLVRR